MLADLLYVPWAYLSTSLSVQIFAVSGALLTLGIAMKVWSQAVHLRGLESTPLNKIEAFHPHIPSSKAITGIFLCTVVLFAVAIQTIAGLPPFNGPNEWLYLAALFIGIGTLGILSELQWKGAKDAAFAFTIGTALAFVFIMFRFSLLHRNPGSAVLVLALLLASTGLAWFTLYREWNDKVRALALCAFVFWIFIYLPV
jgi:hypothetical protein